MIFEIRVCVGCLSRILKNPVRGMCAQPMVFQPKPVKKKMRSRREENARAFIDYRKIRVKGGQGGNGALSFLSLFANEWAGPDGGDGGNGGHVILQADSGKKDFSNFFTVIQGEKGVDGRGKDMHGKNAQHMYLKVPIGTLVKTEEGSFLKDLSKQGELFVAARGGAGGKGNRYFLSNENRAPTTHELGGIGEEKNLILELRAMAHVGLVGFPNAGKSTLLRAISRAKPKVASYPFTTTKPHVGIVFFDDLEQVAVADLPGLVKGAHQNYGLGFSFLRHIERCTCLMYVLDLANTDPCQQLDDLMFELDQYEEGLSQKPHAIVANKVDLPGTQEKLDLLKAKVNIPVYPISAKKLIDIKPLLHHIRELYDNHKEEKNSS